MTERLKDYYYGKSAAVKSVLVPGDPAGSYRVGGSYQFATIGRVKLVSIQTASSHVITDASVVVPACDARLLTGRLANGKMATVQPRPIQSRSRPAKTSNPIPFKLGERGDKGMWLRHPYDVKEAHPR